MTKAEIVEQIYERVGFSKKEAAELVEKVFEIMKETLAEGEKVKISGFGNFVVREKNARKGRNPQTGQEILLDARRVLTFKPSLVLKNVLNETEVTDEDRAAEARLNEGLGDEHGDGFRFDCLSLIVACGIADVRLPRSQLKLV
jgi:integration host factor subunit alpha